jgi:hypothetical protein
VNASPRKSFRRILALSLLLCLMAPMSGCKGGVRGIIAKFRHRKAKSRENTTDYAGNVQQIVSSPRLTIIRLSNYSDYKPHVE